MTKKEEKQWTQDLKVALRHIVRLQNQVNRLKSRNKALKAELKFVRTELGHAIKGKK
jgi:hypothetical protein